MNNFNNKVAVITGAASGIGLAIAEQAASKGMRLMLVDIEQSALDNAKKHIAAQSEVEIHTRVTDVANAEQMDALAESTLAAFGQIDLLVNNAGVGGGGCLWELDTAYWEWVIGVNLWGVIHGIRTFVKHMLNNEEGHIINTASVAGLMSAPSNGPYTATKHAVVGLSETLSGELKNAGSKLGVSVLCPSFVDTNIYAAERNRPMSEEEKNNPERQAQQQAIEEMAAAFFNDAAMPPQAVADLVFKAIEEQQFYILTHPKGSKEQVEKRMRSILEDGQPTSTGPEDYPLDYAE